MKVKSNSSRVRAEIEKDRIISDLRRIGVREGDHIAVTLSLKKIGYLKGGPEALIDALLESVGPRGTIMMNTYTPYFPISEIASDYTFDHGSTPASTGLVPETMRKRRGSARSHHPICSVTAIGKLADYLTKDHDENSHLHMPYSRLANADGKYLCIGLENNLVAIRHESQRLAGLFNVVPVFCGAKYKDGQGKVRTYIFTSPPCARKLPELVPFLRKLGIVKIGRIGMAYSILAPARELIGAMTEMLKKQPTLSLCDDIFCLWCREFERRMKVYREIQNPKYFQKSFFVMTTISLVNSFRLKRYGFLSFTARKRNETDKGWLKVILDLLVGLNGILRCISSEILRALARQ